MFAVWCTDWIDRLMHPVGRVGGARSFDPVSLMFVVVCAYAAVVLHDRFLKASAVAFAAENLLRLIPNVSATASVSLLTNGLIGLAAILLIVAGARRRTRRDLALAAVVFVVMMMVSFGLRQYARYLIGGRSVMYGQG
jgi:uncharacterized membrane protein